MEVPKNVVVLFPGLEKIIRLPTAARRRVLGPSWQPDSGMILFIPGRRMVIADDNASQLLHMFRRTGASLGEIEELKKRFGLNDPDPDDGGAGLRRGRERFMQDQTIRLSQAA